MIRSRRRKSRRPNGRAPDPARREDPFRPTVEPRAEGGFADETDADGWKNADGWEDAGGWEDADDSLAPSDPGYFDPEYAEDPDGDDFGESDEFTGEGGLDGTRRREEEALAAAPDAGPGEPAVASTLLSRKPGRGAALAVGWTLGILGAVSALYWWGPPGFAAALPASGETVFGRGETWRLLTAMAAHADAIHLLSNAAFLTWLIYLSYGAFGPSLYPWSAVPVAALSLAVTLEGYPPNIRLVGASGLLYLLAGSWLTLYVLVERRLTVPKRLVRVIGFFLIVLVPTSIRPEVSYRAHGIGLFFGICLGLAYFLARRDSIRQAERWERRED